MMKVKLTRLREQAQIPTYATEGSAAADLRYAGDEPIVIAPNERRLVPTGIAIEPESSDVAALLFARSGLASKKGLTLANGVGVIDSDYRGEISAAMVNLSSESITIEPGERIAQLMLVPILKAEFEEGELSESERGQGGFGSTGAK